jgi:hypothetical protein
MHLRLRLDAAGETLLALSDALRTADEVWVVSAGLASYLRGEPAFRYVERRLDDPASASTRTFYRLARPEETRLTKHSPMIIDLGIVGNLLPYGLTGGAAGLLVYFLKNLAKIGSFLPEISRSWHQGWTEAEKAKRDRELATTHAELLVTQGRAGSPEGSLEDAMSELGTRVERLAPSVIDTSGISEFAESNQPSG